MTVRRWEREGLLEVEQRTVGNHRRYSYPTIHQLAVQMKGEEQRGGGVVRGEEVTTPSQVLLYVRVSSGEQREDLKRQEDLLRGEVGRDGGLVRGVYKDIGSGLNDKRKGLKRLMEHCIQQQEVDKVYITHRDRMARFGTVLLEHILWMVEVELVVVGERLETEEQKQNLTQEFIQDFIVIITSMNGKYYRMRRTWAEQKREMVN